MNEIASRYGLALFSIAEDRQQILELQLEAKELRKVLLENHDFIVLLLCWTTGRQCRPQGRQCRALGQQRGSPMIIVVFMYIVMSGFGLSSIIWFIDMPSMLFILFVLIPGLLIMGEWKDFIKSFSVGIKQYPYSLQSSKYFSINSVILFISRTAASLTNESSFSITLSSTLLASISMLSASKTFSVKTFIYKANH